MLKSRLSWVDLAILDLFAGTGGLGIEALSRGAASAVFVESSRTATATIRSNLTAAGLQGEVLAMSVARAIAYLAGEGRQFGGVFLDPPYGRGLVVSTLAQLDRAGLVEDVGWIVVEHGRGEDLPKRSGALVRRLHRCYGDTWIALFGVERTSETFHGN